MKAALPSQRSCLFSDIVNAPFRAPATDSYVAKCARLWGRLIMMMLRFLENPSNFPLQLVLSEAQIAVLGQLSEILKGDGEIPVSESIQRVSFLFVATANDHITNDRFSCSLMRFIVVTHLLLDGTFELPSNITPNLSCLQFCMRATCVKEAHERILLCEDSDESLLR
jgi:hypothetical protein